MNPIDQAIRNAASEPAPISAKNKSRPAPPAEPQPTRIARLVRYTYACALTHALYHQFEHGAKTPRTKRLYVFLRIAARRWR